MIGLSSYFLPLKNMNLNTIYDTYGMIGVDSMYNIFFRKIHIYSSLKNMASMHIIKKINLKNKLYASI